MQEEKSKNSFLLRILSILYCWFYFITGKSPIEPLFLMGVVVWSLSVMLLMVVFPSWVARHLIFLLIGGIILLIGVIMPVLAIILNYKDNMNRFLSHAGKDYFRKVEEKLLRTPALVVNIIALLILLLSCSVPSLFFFLFAY